MKRKMGKSHYGVDGYRLIRWTPQISYYLILPPGFKLPGASLTLDSPSPRADLVPSYTTSGANSYSYSEAGNHRNAPWFSQSAIPRPNVVTSPFPTDVFIGYLSAHSNPTIPFYPARAPRASSTRGATHLSFSAVPGYGREKTIGLSSPQPQSPVVRPKARFVPYPSWSDARQILLRVCPPAQKERVSE
ncbi:uncharacterized protein BDW47DRAFT_25890 [Aspergillus candidus]|uniref:Uncharacterized protein n=1 Tax=Aspergillus candidus TaxID=41067 RepID=A0A2I2FNK8_ASPCN|nr:hypothetical protein BDW47DRAFT_25890 [Aspergillus candidus]PLB42217.1 hypothetical protein BDW47DRAFT_25890 [Aspergillus candidus]